MNKLFSKLMDLLFGKEYEVNLRYNDGNNKFDTNMVVRSHSSNYLKIEDIAVSQLLEGSMSDPDKYSEEYRDNFYLMEYIPLNEKAPES